MKKWHNGKGAYTFLFSTLTRNMYCVIWKTNFRNIGKGVAYLKHKRQRGSGSRSGILPYSHQIFLIKLLKSRTKYLFQDPPLFPYGTRWRMQSFLTPTMLLLIWKCAWCQTHLHASLYSPSLTFQKALLHCMRYNYNVIINIWHLRRPLSTLWPIT